MLSTLDEPYVMGYYGMLPLTPALCIARKVRWGRRNEDMRRCIVASLSVAIVGVTNAFAYTLRVHMAAVTCTVASADALTQCMFVHGP